MTIRTAQFSPCGNYRYDLVIIWGDPSNLINFCCLNGSTADAEKNDPTVERLERRARMWGFGGVVVTNIHAWRSTNPDALLSLPDPTGPLNNQYILKWARKCSMVVCGWSCHKAARSRGPAVELMLRMAEIQLHVLRLTKDGFPQHPLYIGYSEKPKPWK